jgi:hypothetical protein
LATSGGSSLEVLDDPVRRVSVSLAFMVSSAAACPPDDRFLDAPASASVDGM